MSIEQESVQQLNEHLARNRELLLLSIGEAKERVRLCDDRDFPTLLEAFVKAVESFHRIYGQVQIEEAETFVSKLFDQKDLKQ